MTAIEEAYRFTCPKCKAKRDEPCTYLTSSWKTTTEYSIAEGRWIQDRHIVQEYGKPTKRPHTERLEKVWREQREVMQRAWLAKRAEETRDEFAEERRAYALVMRQEQERLKWWLFRYGSVLWKT